MAETPADAATLYEERPSDRAEISSIQSESAGIDVVRAERDFNTISRRFSHKPAEKWEQPSTSTVNAPDSDEKDLEKADPESDVFDLREYLTSSNDANQNAGIRHKASDFSCCSPCM